MNSGANSLLSGRLPLTITLYAPKDVAYSLALFTGFDRAKFFLNSKTGFSMPYVKYFSLFLLKGLSIHRAFHSSFDKNAVSKEDDAMAVFPLLSQTVTFHSYTVRDLSGPS